VGMGFNLNEGIITVLKDIIFRSFDFVILPNVQLCGLVVSNLLAMKPQSCEKKFTSHIVNNTFFTNVGL
jgi:hypothetical protein